VAFNIEIQGSFSNRAPEGNRLLVATPAMWEGVVHMLEDSHGDARDVGLQILHEFMNYGDVECSAVPPFLSPYTRQYSGIDFNR
jgi:hypothetical protein